MTTVVSKRSLYATIVGDLLDLIASQPHQILISSASVAIVSAEAATLIPEYYNVAMALGAEWAYLRGMASAGRTRTHWVDVLNWSALALVVLYGMLWGARKFGAISATPDEVGAWVLTAIHIVPVAVLSLSAAMVHRTAIEIETTETIERERAAEQRQLEFDQRRLDMELEHEAEKKRLELWASAQRTKAEIKTLQLSTQPVNTVDTINLNSASQTGVDVHKENLRRQIVDKLKDDPSVNKTELAKTLGISRAYLYNLVNDAKLKGEL